MKKLAFRIAFLGALFSFSVLQGNTRAAVAPEPNQKHLDRVVFGDASSEFRHASGVEISFVAEAETAPSGRVIDDKSQLSFELACDPHLRTHLTLRLWGSAPRGHLEVLVADKQLTTLETGDQPIPGRWYYWTVLLPTEATRNRKSVVATLRGSGSQPVASAFTHLEPLCIDMDYEIGQDAVSEPVQRNEKNIEELTQHLREQVNAGIKTMLAWQCYGKAWDDIVRRRPELAILHGAILPRGVFDAEASAERIKDELAYQTAKGNLAWMRVLELYAFAYGQPWTPFYEDGEMLDRVCAGLDYYCRAQGNNGGFDDIWTHKWVGGPQRRVAGGCLEGFGHRGLASALLRLSPELESRSLLEVEIDHDADPSTRPLPRRQAYAALFRNSRDYLVSSNGRGHAPNQDMADVLAAYLANNCLRILAPAWAWCEPEALRYVHEGAGLLPFNGEDYWVSPKGLILEPQGTSNGGYDCQYGDSAATLLCALAEATSDQRVKDQAGKALDALAYFRLPGREPDGRPALYKEPYVSWRNDRLERLMSYGGGESVLCDQHVAYAATELGNLPARRGAQLWLGQNQQFQTSLRADSGHYPDQIASLAHLIDRLPSLGSLPETEYRLPMEGPRNDFIWADETSGTIVIRDGDVCLWMSLNFRHDFEGDCRRENALVNNEARIRYSRSGLDVFATTAMESPHGFGNLYICRFGNYVVYLNGSADTSYRVDWNVLGKADETQELVSEQTYHSGEDILVAPSSTMVFCVRRN